MAPSAVIIVGNWLSTMRHEGTVNGAFQMWVCCTAGCKPAVWAGGHPSPSLRPTSALLPCRAPIGCFITAVVGPLIDPKYTEVCYDVAFLDLASWLIVLLALV
jgi:hypothetical protein